MNQRRQRSGPHFPHHVGAVNFDRLLADRETIRDALIGLAADHQVEDLPLARRQGIESPISAESVVSFHVSSNWKILSVGDSVDTLKSTNAIAETRATSQHATTSQNVLRTCCWEGTIVPGYSPSIKLW